MKFFPPMRAMLGAAAVGGCLLALALSAQEATAQENVPGYSSGGQLPPGYVAPSYVPPAITPKEVPAVLSHEALPLLPASDLVGEMSSYTTVGNETLMEVGVRFHIGYTELVAANPGVDPYMPGEGYETVLPTHHILPHAPREGIVIDLAEQRLYFFRGSGQPVFTAPIGIGDEGNDTPHGKTYVAFKKANPIWVPPPSIRAERPELPLVVYPGPDNPLGTHAIYLGWPRYLIHGTHKPLGVGRRVSHGCIRMLPADIPKLFAMVSHRTPVYVMYDPVKLGHHNGELYLEVHPTLAQAQELERHYTLTPEPIPNLASRIADIAPEMLHRVNWEIAEQAVMERRGYPVQITGVTAISEGSGPGRGAASSDVASIISSDLPPVANGQGISSGNSSEQPVR
jgi:L,D-transpeptidase ErfK/SrfK